MALSKNTVSRGIDEMSDAFETQLIEKLKSRYSSLQMDELTQRDREVVLLVYARYIDKGEFCKSLETTDFTADIYVCGQLNNYLRGSNIPMSDGLLCDGTETTYPHSTIRRMVARKLLLPFPSSYLAECGFTAVNDLLLKKRNRLDITKPGDLRLRLNKLEPDIKSLCRRHDASNH
ncbi:uncharacterized protein TNCV_4077061 [Trichonephila clavipes]|nr:uncharacterized protein TNCV_4077061 [Trichonephila clavipes]